MRNTLRRTVVLLALGLVAAGCSGQGADDDSARGPAAEEAGPGSTEAAAADAFPLTVDTPYGPVTLDEPPTEIVAVSLDAVEALLALGVTPIAAPDLFQVGPWVADAAGGDTTFFTPRIDQSDATLEYLLSLDPDLIVGSRFFITEENHDDLAGIAPTISFGDEAGATTAGSWEELTRMLGDVVGRPDEADRVVTETLAAIEAVADEHPGVAGRTVAFAAASSVEEITAADSSEHSGLRFLEALGLEVADLGGAGDEFGGGRTTLSLENLDLLDRADLLVLGSFSPELRAGLEESPLYASLEVVQEDRVAALDEVETTALNTPTALNIPVLLDLLGPVLARVEA
jgi:iron complex transport system substrate-binding protein